MTPIQRFLLRAKQWQIFVIVCGIYLFGQIEIYSTTSSTSTARPDHAFAFRVIGAACMSIVFLWLWFLGTSLNSMRHLGEREGTGPFSIACSLTVIYLVVLAASLQNPNARSVLGPLGVVPMICSLYVLQFVAKIMVLVEKKQVPTFYEYAGPFFLLWFFPLGIWFVQPRVNRIYELNSDSMATIGSGG